MEDNKILVRRLVEEVLNKGDVAPLDQLLADNYINHSLPPGVPPSRDGFAGLVKTVSGAFPDAQVTIEDMVAEGDRVMFRDTTTGTQAGPFQGVPASGKKIAWTEMHLFRIENGKIVEHWMQIDQLGMMMQLGAIPAPR